MRKLLLLTVIGAFMMSFSPGWAEIPHLINYQGMLTDNGENPITEPRDLTFTIYDAPTNGTALWTETHTAVPIEDGLFNVILGGATTPIPDSVFDAPERYLGIKVGTDAELTPRIQLVSVGYAYRARAAEYAEASGTAETDRDWTVSNDDMYAEVSGNVGIGTTSPTTDLDVLGNRIRLAAGVDPSAKEIMLRTDGTEIDLDVNNADLFIKSNTGNTILQAFGGNVGIGTASPDVKLHLKGDPSVYLCFDHSGEKTWKLGSNKIDNENFQILEATTSGSVVRARFKLGGDIHLAPVVGNVGIGTGSPTEKLDVNGTARLRGISDAPEVLTPVVVDANGVLYKEISPSSIRYKKNIREIEIDPEDILKLQTVRFEWKESGKEDVGLIAEDVEKAVPDLVIYNDEGRPNGVRYDKLALYLLETVKELKSENDALRSRIEVLESRE